MKKITRQGKTEKTMKYSVTEKDAGKLLLTYLKGTLGLSRAEIIALKKREGGILLNGSPVTVRAVLSAGDELLLDRCDREEELNECLVRRELPLSFLYEDDDLIAVNKPAGMPTHPSHGHFDDTLANGLAYVFSQKGIPFVFRAVNRLDRDTSGVVLVAKNRGAAFRMAEQIAGKEIDKRYLAVAEGRIFSPFTVTAPIKRQQESIILRTVCRAGEGQEAETEFFPLGQGEDFTLLEAHPLTGRTHQIRVHLASVGHPLCGDTLYGGGTLRIGRQALHCRSLTFSLPAGERITVTAPLPEDMKALAVMAGYSENEPKGNE